MKRLFLLAFCMTVSGSLLIAQQTPPAAKEKLQEAKTKDYLYRHISFLSHEELKGRNTATEDQQRAAEYIADNLKAYGIQPFAKDSLGNITWYQDWPYVLRFGDKRKYNPYSQNVIGLLPASKPSDEYIVISAHYDHLGILNDTIYPGADDNGTGTAALLEMARLFSMDERPRDKNILFIFFSGEEKGLLGAKHYAENPMVPMEKVVANINIDMIGRADSAHAADSNYIYVIGSDRISTRLDSLLHVANELNNPLTLDYKYNDPEDPQRLYERSDHYHFAKKGVPVVFFFSGLHPDYHRPTDTLEKINIGVLYNRMHLAYRLVYQLSIYDKSLR